MKWSFILFLPALVSGLWAFATLLLRRKLTRAQVMMSFTLIMIAFALIVMSVFFRGKAGGLFIYDFLFKSVTIFTVPLYYMGICALTEPRGSTLWQRRTFVVPLLFVAGLTVCAFYLGPRRYEEMCHAVVAGGVQFVQGDSAWNNMLFWDYLLFPALTLVYSAATMIVANHKFKVFVSRFNEFYADHVNLPKVNSSGLVVATLLYFVVGSIQVLLVEFRFQNYKYWLIACAILLTVIQFFVGRQVYKMKYDSRFFAKLKK